MGLSRPATFRRMLEIIERNDPGYAILRRTVLSTDLEWKYAPTQAMDFRAQSLKVRE